MRGWKEILRGSGNAESIFELGLWSLRRARRRVSKGSCVFDSW